MVKSVKVPDQFLPLFEQAEQYVSALFDSFTRSPEQGAIRLGDERYILVRGESLFIALFDQLEAAFGRDTARDFIYNMARFIGKSDCKHFSEDRAIVEPHAKLSSGPVHFAYSGWARVHIHPDSYPAPSEEYYLHYDHPNTFESEVYKSRNEVASEPVCIFSAGYSSGWCSEAYGLEVYAREVQCEAAGDPRCEFVMAPFDRLDEHISRLGKPPTR